MMIDRKTLDDVLLKQRDTTRWELGNANMAVYNIAGQYILEIFNDSKKKCITEEEIYCEFSKKHDTRFAREDISSAIEKLVDSKKLVRYRIGYELA